MKYLLAALLFASVAGAQTPSGNGVVPVPPKPQDPPILCGYIAGVDPVPTSGPCAPKSQPALTCGKYQHVEHWTGRCGPALCDEKTGECYAVCTPAPPDKCVDDMHEVTEREWQEMKARIAELERQLRAAKKVQQSSATSWNVYCDAATSKSCVSCPVDKDGHIVCKSPGWGLK